MKPSLRLLIAASLASVLGSCATNPKQQAKATSLIYPGSVFTGVTNEESVISRPYFRDSLDESERNDPFFTNRLTSVNYEWHGSTLRKVAAFYQRALHRFGWRELRPVSFSERTLCGGDWGGVFEKNGLQFKLHCCGPWEKLKAEQNGKVVEWFGQGYISFYFINTPPESVLGTNYTLK